MFAIRIQQGLWIAILALIGYPLLVFARPFLMVFVVMSGVGWLVSKHVKTDSVDRNVHASRIPWAVGLMMVCLTLGILEWIEPLYFFRSDNKVMFFPIMTFAAESFFRGVFPVWNPYQFMGQPILGSGLYALNYPPVYLSYAIARAVLRNEALCFDVFAWLHLIPGYLVSFQLLIGRFRFHPWIAALTALTFVLSGFMLIGGRDWYYMLPLAFWFPVIMASYFDWVDTPRISTAIKLGISCGLLLHGGNAQMWVYTQMILVIGGLAFVACGRCTRRHWASLALIALVAFVMSAPTLIPQLCFGAQAPWKSIGDGIIHRLVALVIPWIKVAHPNNWGAYSSWSWTPLFFVGYVSVFAAMAYLADYWIGAIRRQPSKRNLHEPQLMAMFLFSFAMALGPSAVFWKLFSFIPIVNKFGQPFKFLAFLAFLVPILGGIWLSRLLERLQEPFRRRTLLGFLTLGFAGLAIHIWQARATYDYFQDGYFPKMPLPIRQIANSEGRLLSYAPAQPVSEHYYDSLPHNLATRFRLLHRSGYDGLVENHPESQINNAASFWDDYAVKWVAVAASRKKEFERDSAGLALVRLFGDANIELYEVPGAAHIAETERGQILPYRLDANGVLVDLRSVQSSATVTLNFIRRGGMSAFVDGLEIPVKSDPLKRVEVAIPQNAKQLRLNVSGYGPIGYATVITLTLIWILWLVLYCGEFGRFTLADKERLLSTP